MSDRTTSATAAGVLTEVLAPGHGEVAVSGPHRLVTADRRTGCLPLSRGTELTVTTDALTGPVWSIGLWICPAEDLDTATTLEWTRAEDPGAQRYRLVDEAAPAGETEPRVFSWAWLSMLRPAMLVTVADGRASSGTRPVATAQVEHLPLREGTWYRMVITFSAADHRLCIWVNGLLAGISDFDFHADVPGTVLHMGNPSMAFAGLTIEDRAWTADEVRADFAASASSRSQQATEELRPLYEAPTAPASTVAGAPDRSVELPARPTDWELQMDAAFTDPEDLAGWIRHGCRTAPHQLVACETTPEGLLVQTPDHVAEESRLYLWSPRVFEGDLIVEFDFRVEQDSGFAMLVIQASGMQGEDFLTDRPAVDTGAMSVIARSHVRNYYWGFYRRTPTTPKHIASHTLVKNPWMRNLDLAASERLEVGAWHRLRMVQEGPRIWGEIDGRIVVDGRDDPWQNHGPVLRRGRIALRLMYQTRARFRNLRVWSRPGLIMPSAGEDQREDRNHGDRR